MTDEIGLRRVVVVIPGRLPLSARDERDLADVRDAERVAAARRDEPPLTRRSRDNVPDRREPDLAAAAPDAERRNQILRKILREVAHAAAASGMIDDGFHPTPLLGTFVTGVTDGTADETMREILESKYAGVLELGMNATQAQLVDAFRDLNVNGSTLRKAIRFFLAAAEFAGIKVSPHFKAPPTDPSERRARKPKATAKTDPKPIVPAVSQITPPSALHPFIAGLVGTLPAPGSFFPEQMQKAWFDTAAGIFRLIYTSTIDLSDADMSDPDPDPDPDPEPEL